MNSSLRNLRIADLDLFISAARLKSLGKAAKLHHLSQSGASSAIMRVEEAFEKPLCTHEKRAFRLTKEGIELVALAEEWLQELVTMASFDQRFPLRLATTHAIARVSVPVSLAHEIVQVQLMRPDSAYAQVLRDEADIALVLDNAPWEDVVAEEVASGYFQLYSRQAEVRIGPVLLPEDQIEVLTLQQRWQKMHGSALPVKARLPSWSLIADICSKADEIGFLPDFLAFASSMRKVPWQPEPFPYRLLALYRSKSHPVKERIKKLIAHLKASFVKASSALPH